MKVTFSEILNHFEHPQVRDLVWTIGSPHLTKQIDLSVHHKDWDQEFIDDLKLIDVAVDKLLAYSLPKLKELEADPSVLFAALEVSKQKFSRVRLGIYYEHLVHFFLEYILGFDPLWREIQIFEQSEKGKHTIGSIDMLGKLAPNHALAEIFGQNQNDYHVEVASKFYLKVPIAEAHLPKSEKFPVELSRYIGPNERDSFGSKLARLFTHQLPLTNDRRAQTVLEQYKLKIDHRLLWCKGRIFYHFQDVTSIQKQRHENAFWVRQHDIEALFESELIQADKVLCMLCPKPNWLAPPSIKVFEVNASSHSVPSLLQTAQQERGEKGSTLWYGYSSTRKAYFWLMIVPDLWGKRKL